ncbi:hypothetical protein CRUP_004959 [Coryphaenoides rupestris]|nr:hypothetical protein CRUP_004959 [Coryphaenoides rupestris]
MAERHVDACATQMRRRGRVLSPYALSSKPSSRCPWKARRHMLALMSVSSLEPITRQSTGHVTGRSNSSKAHCSGSGPPPASPTVKGVSRGKGAEPGVSAACRPKKVTRAMTVSWPTVMWNLVRVASGPLK